MKGLQQRNIGCHHLGSRGYGGKRSIWAKEDAEAASLGISDEDMTTLDTTKNIAYMHICQVISNANYAKNYLCYPGQKYFIDFCAMSNCRYMGHLYNPHMKIRGKISLGAIQKVL